MAAKARHLSDETIKDYTRSFAKFINFLDGKEPLIDDISPRIIEAFLASQERLANKSLLNQYIAL